VSWLRKDGDDLAVHIRRVVSATQVERTRRMVPKIPLLLSLMLAILLRDPSVIQQWEDTTLCTYFYYLFGWLGHILLALIVCTTWMLWPQTCTPFRTQVVQTVFALMSIALALTAEDAVNFVMGMQTLTVLRVLMGILTGNVLLTAVTNIAAGVMNYWALRRLLFSFKLDPFMAAMFDGVDTTLIGVQEVFVIISAIVVCKVLALHTHQEVTALVQAQVAAQSEHNIRCLLRSLCDAEIKLNASLEVMDSSPALGGLLVTREKLQGTNFASLVHEEDREAFVKLMESKTKSRREEGLTPAMHVNLVDNNGCLVNVQMYISTSTDTLGRIVHHVGMCESAADRSVAVEAEAVQAMPVTSKFSFSPSSDTSSLSVASTMPELEVWVDPLTPGLKVFQCTLALAMLLGRSHSSSRWCLAKTIVDSDMFMCRLQCCVQEALYMSEHETTRIELGSFIFQPFPCGTSRRAMFQAQCFIEGGLQGKCGSETPSQSSFSGSGGAELAVKIVLIGLTKLPKPKHHRGRFDSGTSTTASKPALRMSTSL